MPADTSGIIDTRFRTALRRLDRAGRLLKVRSKVDPHLELAAIISKRDADQAIFFEQVAGFSMPVCANFLASHANVLEIFGLDVEGVRQCMLRGYAHPIPPVMVERGPCQEVVLTSGLDLEKLLPVPFHAKGDAGRTISSSIVIAKDPDTGVRNVSFHRLQLYGGNRTGVKLDLGRHLETYYNKAKARREPLPIAVCIGTDLAVFYGAVAMGAEMPIDKDELELAGGIKGAPIELVKCRTVPLEVPAESEIVIEGYMPPDVAVDEGPFGEFTGYNSTRMPAPVLDVTCLSHRKDPLYYTIIGGERGMLRKYILEASILSTMKKAVPIVQDVELTPGGSVRFHLVIQVKKTLPHHEGLQRNAILAAITSLKDLDWVVVVDHDVDIRNPLQVEWAISTRFEASRDLILIPAARGHEYIPVSDRGLRTKVGIDATFTQEQMQQYDRVTFQDVDLAHYDLTNTPGLLLHPALQEPSD
ncbi:MAG: UbiD family decarboxylase [Deltaproteobacteria bacterium]|nr:UbiD family decarboxylase [Deltaproteobacteria bacterium]